MRLTSLGSSILILGLGATAWPTASQVKARWPVQPVPVGAPAKPNSAQPQLTVSPKGVLLSWIERNGAESTLKFAERTSGGWSAAQVVATGKDWFVNWADVPSVIRLDDGTLVGHWLQKSGPDTYAYDVRLSHSR